MSVSTGRPIPEGWEAISEGLGHISVRRDLIIEAMDAPGMDQARLNEHLDDVSGLQWEQRYLNILAKIATLPEVEAELTDARRSLGKAKWQRTWTSRQIRARASDEPQCTMQSGLRLPDGDKLFAVFATVFLLASLIFLNYTAAQMILTERIYPGFKTGWQAALVSGAVQAGLLMVPLTLAKSITGTRAHLLFRMGANLAAMICSALFIYWLWEHGDIAAARSFNARSGAADLVDLAQFTLNLTHIEGKARVISILGEAFGAIAVKLNIDYLRGAHLMWRLVPNPERALREAEVIAARENVKRCKQETDILRRWASEYERGLRTHRRRYRAEAEAISRDWDALMHVMDRALRRAGRNETSWKP